MKTTPTDPATAALFDGLLDLAAAAAAAAMGADWDREPAPGEPTFDLAFALALLVSAAASGRLFLACQALSAVEEVPNDPERN